MEICKGGNIVSHSTSDYLAQLQTDKQTLVDNLVTKGVSATSDETFTSLVPKVLDISTGTDIEITDASYLFYYGARDNQIVDLLKLCKNVTNCNYMFGYCRDMTSLDLSNFDTSQVTNMSNMFYYCTKLTQIDVSNFDTSQVTDVVYMFRTCSSLTELDVSNFDTSQVTNMSSMFGECKKLTQIDVSNFDTSQVTTIYGMFNSCESLTELDLSSFDTSNVTNTGRLTRLCSKLEKLIINRQDVFKMTETSMIELNPIARGTGYIYVPDNMVETYKSATNWSVYADQIKGMSELPTEEA